MSQTIILSIDTISPSATCLLSHKVPYLLWHGWLGVYERRHTVQYIIHKYPPHCQRVNPRRCTIFVVRMTSPEWNPTYASIQVYNPITDVAFECARLISMASSRVASSYLIFKSAWRSICVLGRCALNVILYAPFDGVKSSSRYIIVYMWMAGLCKVKTLCFVVAQLEKHT